MYSPPVLVTPGSAPVTLAEVKAVCRSKDFADDDDVLQIYLDAGISYLDGTDGILGKSIRLSTFEIHGPAWHSFRFPLPDVDHASVAISYRDPSTTVQTLASTDFYLVREILGDRLCFRDVDALPVLADDPDAISISFVAGIDPAKFPTSLKLGILLSCARWFENPDGLKTKDEAFAEIPGPARQMFGANRVYF